MGEIEGANPYLKREIGGRFSGRMALIYVRFWKTIYTYIYIVGVFRENYLEIHYNIGKGK